MLADAEVIFSGVPAAFADPLGLAAGQTRGVVALIVVTYPRGPSYDAFLAVGGHLVAAARTTPDFRVALLPAAALRRFTERRADADAPTLSVLRLSPALCRLFLESVFYHECLKVHVCGAGSAALVAAQLQEAGCTRGLIEINDFSDPHAPCIALYEVERLVQDGEALDGMLARLLDGYHGRVLLYDREKNTELALGPAAAIDVETLLNQAQKLTGGARTAPSVASPASSPARASAPSVDDTPTSPSTPPSAADAEPEERPNPAATEANTPRAEEPEDLTACLQSAAQRPNPLDDLEEDDPGLTALLVELQGEATVPSPLADFLPALTTPRAAMPLPAHPALDEDVVSEAAPAALGAEAMQEPSPLPFSWPSDDPPIRPEAHDLAVPLERLQVALYAAFEAEVGSERAATVDAHVLERPDLQRPLPPADVLPYLRALLTEDPPKRWHGFKRLRGRCYDLAARKLHAFFLAHRHTDLPEVSEASRLWARLHR